MVIIIKKQNQKIKMYTNILNFHLTAKKRKRFAVLQLKTICL